MSVKDDRLQIRVDPEAKRVLEQAAATAHLNLSSFVLQSAQLRAGEILAERTTVTLKPDAAAAFDRALAEPARVSDRLATALGRARKFSWLD